MSSTFLKKFIFKNENNNLYKHTEFSVKKLRVLVQQNFESPASLSDEHCKTAVGAERIGIFH